MPRPQRPAVQGEVEVMSILCVRPKCGEEAYCKVNFSGQWLCLKHFKELGDFDDKGRLADRRRKR